MKKLLFLLVISPFWGYGQYSATGEHKFVSMDRSPDEKTTNPTPVSDDYLGGDHKYVRIFRADYKRTEGIFKNKFVFAGNVEVQIDDVKIMCDSSIVDNETRKLYCYGNIVVSSGGVQMNTTNLQIDFTDHPRLVFNPEDAKALGLKSHNNQ